MTRINYQTIMRNGIAIATIAGLLTVIVLWLRQAFPVFSAGITIQG